MSDRFCSSCLCIFCVWAHTRAMEISIYTHRDRITLPSLGVKTLLLWLAANITMESMFVCLNSHLDVCWDWAGGTISVGRTQRCLCSDCSLHSAPLSLVLSLGCGNGRDKYYLGCEGSQKRVTSFTLPSLKMADRQPGK